MRLLLAALFLALLSPALAYADCTNPPAVEGKLIFNGDENVPQFCDGTNWIALGVLNPSAGGSGCSNPAGVEGKIVYNGDVHKPQYCDGDDWREMIGYLDAPEGGGCAAPASCTSVGDVCSDGSIFAGFVVYSNSSCEPLYVTDNDQSTASQWKIATGTNDISTDDHVDGNVNHANRGGAISDFPAFDLCESNTYHGKSDWYLPARAELNLLWLNRAAINANAAGNFTTEYYWSSTEDTPFNDDGWSHNFSVSGGNQSSGLKTSNRDVRCVRRAVTTPDPCAGSPSPGDVCADGSVYAGLSPDGNVAMYTTPADAPGTYQYGPGTPDTAVVNCAGAPGPETGCSTGRANTDILAALAGAYDAAKYCDNLTAHGRNDWYLPAQTELDVLYTNRSAIGGFASAEFWSSSEDDFSDAWRKEMFGAGVYDSNWKPDPLNVRCVRR